jgi:predicted RNase H-like HicB family nuclease
MKTIEIIIERAEDGTFGAYCVGEKFSGMGDSPEEAKNSLVEQMNLFKEYCKDEGLEYPSYLNDGYELVLKFDTESLLQYYAGIITPAALERLTGISRKQLWSYMHGRSKPREAQVNKIASALHKLGEELVTLSL